MFVPGLPHVVARLQVKGLPHVGLAAPLLDTLALCDVLLGARGCAPQCRSSVGRTIVNPVRSLSEGGDAVAKGAAGLLGLLPGGGGGARHAGSRGLGGYGLQDSSHVLVHSFGARTEAELTQWLEALCGASGQLEVLEEVRLCACAHSSL